MVFEPTIKLWGVTLDYSLYSQHVGVLNGVTNKRLITGPEGNR